MQEWSEPLRAAIGDWVFALVQFCTDGLPCRTPKCRKTPW